MRVNMWCPECGGDKLGFVLELPQKNDCVYEVECPHGHQFRANILHHEFQKLFEIAVDAIVDGNYREAIGSFAASYERFIELFVRVVLKSAGTGGNEVGKGWKLVARQSERQLGAFVFVYLLQFKTAPVLLHKDFVTLRNDVVHQGYFPDKKECSDYGSAVLDFIRANIKLLYESDEHRNELSRSINDKADRSPGGALFTHFPWSMVETNAPPGANDPTFEQLVLHAAAVKRILSSVR